MNIYSEMAANVWKVLVSEGDRVTEGQAIAILESMKIEIPVCAPSAGIITTVAMTEGGAVDEGGLLAVVGE